MASRLSDDRYAEVVAALVAARASTGVTQVELARKLARHQSYVSKVERRERRVDVVEFRDWLAALGVDPNEVFADLAKSLQL